MYQIILKYQLYYLINWVQGMNAGAFHPKRKHPPVSGTVSRVNMSKVRHHGQIRVKYEIKKKLHHAFRRISSYRVYIQQCCKLYTNLSFTNLRISFPEQSRITFILITGYIGSKEKIIREDRLKTCMVTLIKSRK